MSHRSLCLPSAEPDKLDCHGCNVFGTSRLLHSTRSAASCSQTQYCFLAQAGIEAPPEEDPGLITEELDEAELWLSNEQGAVCMI